MDVSGFAVLILLAMIVTAATVIAYIIETVSLLTKNELFRSIGRLSGGIWRLVAGTCILIPASSDQSGVATFIAWLVIVSGVITLGSGINKLRNCLKAKKD